MTITQSELKEILHYDPETGVFTRIKRMGKRGKIGDEAGTKDTGGYICIKIFGTSHKAHRLAWLYVHGKFPTLPKNMIDHINGNKDDNRIINLREATHSQNMANTKSYSSSGYKGVSKSGKKWRAQITIDNKPIYIGTYDTKEEAHEAYKQAALKHHKEFAKF